MKIYTSHFISRVRKGCSRFVCERELETEQNWNILTPFVMTVNVSFSFFWCSTGALGSTLLGAGFLYYSYQHLLWTPTHQGPKPLRPGVAFPTTSRLSPSPTLLGLQLNCQLPATQLATPLAPKLNCHCLVKLNWVI